MGNFDGRGDSLDIKSDKERVLSFLISRIKHLLAIGGSSRSLIHVPLWKL